MTKTYGFDTNGLVNSESVEGSYKINVTFKAWNGTRYYVTRDGKQIGWVSIDLTTAKGTTSTHEYYLNQMINAINTNK